VEQHLYQELSNFKLTLCRQVHSSRDLEYSLKSDQVLILARLQIQIHPNLSLCRPSRGSQPETKRQPTTTRNLKYQLKLNISTRHVKRSHHVNSVTYHTFFSSHNFPTAATLHLHARVWPPLCSPPTHDPGWHPR
jgi:hypothetical protein